MQMQLMLLVLLIAWRFSLISLQDVFIKFADQYNQKHKSSPQQFKVLNSITSCRTSKLGGHANICNNCGNVSIAYNSCRDRHCPMCQSIKREKWRVDRTADLLNTRYFHIVFTVPDSLNSLFYHNQNVLYSTLMKTAANTLLELTKQERHLGAEIGLTGILHTWSQTLSYHPHVHFIVPGGGLCLKTKKFKETNKKFFIPFEILSDVFRGKVKAELKKLLSLDQLINWKTGKPITKAKLKYLINLLYKERTVVNIKPTFESPVHVIKYLCQYTHRVAISNHRIISMDDETVSFKYKDNKDKDKNGIGKTKIMTLKGTEFIRRFLMHVLPNRFVKIRHYGIFAGRNRPTKLAFCQRLMNLIPSKKAKEYSTIEFLKLFMNIKINTCVACNKLDTTEIVSLESIGIADTS